jgi:hypothetical protein
LTDVAQRSSQYNHNTPRNSRCKKLAESEALISGIPKKRYTEGNEKTKLCC